MSRVETGQTHFDLARHIPLTPYTLPLAIWDIINAMWPQKSVTFTEDSPRQAVQGPTIVWKILRRVGGRDGLETNKTRLRGEFRDPDDPTLFYEQWAQWMTTIYQFDVYSTSNTAVNELMEEFEDLLINMVPRLKELGVSEFLFDEQISDVDLKDQNIQDVYRRTLRFRCFLERKVIKTPPVISSIWLQTGVKSSRIVWNEQITRGSMTAKDSLSNKWVTSIGSITQYLRQDADSHAPTGSQFIENVDFRLCVTAPSGNSIIEWLPRAKHPQPGETFYVTYSHKELDPAHPITNTE